PFPGGVPAVGEADRGQRNPAPQVLAGGPARGAEAALPRPHRRSPPAMEAQPHRPRVAAAVVRLLGGPGPDARGHGHEGRPLVHRPLRRQEARPAQLHHALPGPDPVEARAPGQDRHGGPLAQARLRRRGTDAEAPLDPRGLLTPTVGEASRGGGWMSVLPVAGQLRGYRREWLRGDLVGGVSACVVMIPSVIAYADLVGLPPTSGLYAALAAVVGYALFAS